MSSYRIDPAGVSAVLKDVEQAADDVLQALSGLSTAGDDVRSGTLDCAEVSAAVAALLERESHNIATISNRISAGLYGAATATSSYITGDETMSDDVTTAQEQAVQSASSGDFSWFAQRQGGRR